MNALKSKLFVFIDDVSSSGYTVSSGWTTGNNAIERMLKETVLF
jgi:hypothetical protein